MTARQVYEAILIELNKENAPNILLEDFNYLFNKGINQYVNKRYNIYDISQQTTDDLRVLKATALLKPEKCSRYGTNENDISNIMGRAMGATYEVILPSDYLHILNCICFYKVNKTFKCYNKGDIWRSPATKLTADAYSKVLDNFWLKPTYRRPYYYIHNVNRSVFEESQKGSIIPTDDIRDFYDNKGSLNTTNKYYIGYLTTNELNSITSSSNALREFITSYGTSYIPAEINLEGSHSQSISGAGQDFWIISPSNEEIPVYSSNPTDSNAGEITQASDNIVYYQGTFKIKHMHYAGGKIYTKGKKMNDIDITIGTDPVLGEFSNNGIDSHNNEIISINENSGVRTNILINNGDGTYTSTSNVERAAQVRYGNASPVRMEIRYGSDSSLFTLQGVYIDYIKVPQTIRLTQEQLDLTEDTSQMLEFPDYVCQEIINELVNLVMENIADPRLQTHPVVSQSIANPAQQQTESAAQQS